MRLTNEMRDDFADAVIRKIPVKSDWNREKIITEIERCLFDSLQDDVKAFATKHPNLINRTSYSIDWLTFKRDDGCLNYGRASGVISCDLAKIDVDDLKEHWDKFKRERFERRELQRRIRDQAQACATLAQLQLMFPDLKGLVDDLVKVGLEIPQ